MQQVVDCVGTRGVLHNVWAGCLAAFVCCVLWRPAMQRLCDAVGGRARKRVGEPELFEERLMREEVDILEVVVCFVLAMDLLLGLAGMDAFQDAEAPAAEHMLGICLGLARHSTWK